MMRPAAAIRSGVSLIVMALVRGDRRDAPGVDDDAQQVDRFLEVGVAQVERADDLFLVLAPLGRRVGDDGDRARRRDALEVARRAATRRRAPRRASTLRRSMRDRLIAERRIEHDVDVGELADRR